MGPLASPPPARMAPRAQGRIFLGAGLLIALLLATNAAVVLHLRHRELYEQATELASTSLILAEQADHSFQSIDLVLASVADYMASHGVTDESSFRREMGTQEIHRLLREKLSGMPELDAVTMVDAGGTLVNFSRYWPVPEVHVTDRDYYQALKADPALKTFISAPVQNRGTGTWTIYLARRVNGRDGEFLGLILGAVQLKYFEDFYRSVSIGHEGSIVLVRGDGIVFVRYPPIAGVGRSFGAEHILAGGTTGTVRELSPIDGRMRLKAARTLANYPLFVLVTKSEAAALANWRSMARLIGLAALAAAVSMAVGAFLLARHLRQQAHLAWAEEQITETERARLLAEAEVRRQRELTAAFEAMRAAKDEAEAASRAKSEFLATMSHELRTPLNAIIGFSDMMIHGTMGPLENRHYRGYAQDINASGAHLLAIINDILDLSKAAAGKLELVEGRCDAREIVTSTCRLMRQRIEEAGVSLGMTLPADAVTLYADDRKLKQILLNLLSNAYRFTPGGGCIDCRLAVEADAVVFAVSDTGIGIPPEHLDRVLNPFVQLESSYRRKRDGTGLGLALVKAMTELHGGKLRLESAPGLGTTVSVRLPLDRLVPASAVAATG
jgi:signal transduction histidine kinase